MSCQPTPIGILNAITSVRYIPRIGPCLPTFVPCLALPCLALPAVARPRRQTGLERRQTGETVTRFVCLMFFCWPPYLVFRFALSLSDCLVRTNQPTGLARASTDVNSVSFDSDPPGALGFSRCSFSCSGFTHTHCLPVPFFVQCVKIS